MKKQEDKKTQHSQVFRIKLRKPGGLDAESPRWGEIRLERKEAGLCRPWDTFKESVLHQEQGGATKGLSTPKFWQNSGESSTI